MSPAVIRAHRDRRRGRRRASGPAGAAAGNPGWRGQFAERRRILHRTIL